jgi:cytochrome c551/c552
VKNVGLILLYSILLFLLWYCNSVSKRKDNGEKIQKGYILFNHLGCANCHSVTGEKRYGPALDGIVNTKIQVYENGKKMFVIVTREYLQKSIVDPEFQKVAGYEHNKMIKPDLSRDDVDCLVDYIVSLSGQYQ